MNQAHLHLALGHFPIVATVIGVLILLYGIISNRADFQKSALTVLVLAAVVALPVFLAGEGAEEIVEKIEGINKDDVERHEELATVTFWIITVNGMLSIIQLILMRKQRIARLSLLFILIVALSCSILGLLTANLGGKIRHPEIVEKQT